MYRMSCARSWSTRCIAALSIAVTLGVTNVGADNLALEPKSDAEWKRAVNDGTVRILTKGLGCTCTVIASDMASVLNETGSLRILPVIGHGSLQGIADVMYLRGIDLSILQADVLSYVKRNNIHNDIEQRVRYVTKLYNSELHLIAGHDIETIQDLDGELVSYDVKGRGSFITAENVFESLGIEVEPVHYERDVAIEKIKQGEIAAAFVVTGKPADSVRKIGPGSGLHFLSVPMTDDLREAYLPSTLTHDDYPQFIEPGEETINTIAVPEVLAVYNWSSEHERYGKVKAVVEAFFENFDKFKTSVRHPKWKNVDLTADLPGWERFQPAQDWLDQNTTITEEKGFELNIGDRVIRVRKDRIEDIDRVESPSPDESATSVVMAYPTDIGGDLHQTASAVPLRIGVAPASASEGDASLDFNITLSRPVDIEVPIIFKTVEGTAKAEVDFKEKSGLMVIEPGVTKAALEIDMIDDQLVEDAEDLSLLLYVDPSIAELEQQPYGARIEDDD